MILCLLPLGMALADRDGASATDVLLERMAGALDGVSPDGGYAQALAAGLELMERGIRDRKALALRIVQARKDEDVVLVTCLVDKQEQLEVVLGKAQLRLSALLDAADDGADVSGDFVVLAMYAQRVQLLAQEAAACTSSGQDPDALLFQNLSPAEGDDKAGGAVDADGLAPNGQLPMALPPPIASPIR